ncbi:MAG: XdhC/CoxI family protein [Acidobacteriota bacterium]|nr:XdhC/CoxI family protein [Acidobacteriota bacterium]
MRDVLPEIERWRDEGKRIAVATVVKVWGSAPRPLGSKMAVTSAGDMTGSVSGGCVEGAVVEEAQSVLQSGEPKLLRFGVTNEEAWAVGLSCGGEIEIFLEMHNELFRALKRCLDDERLAVVVTVVAGAGSGRQLLFGPDDLAIGDLGSPELNRRAEELAAEARTSFRCTRATLESDGSELDLFVDVHPPRPQLVVVGAVHVAIPLVGFATTLGFHTIVVDPRSAFATRERFPHVDRLLPVWPAEAFRDVNLHEGSYLAVLSHDLKIDLPAIEIALRSPVRYIGALGSKKTHAKRVAALEKGGFSKEEIARIHSPIGFDLGGRRAEEIAVSIMAEVIAVSHGIGVRPKTGA